MVVRKTEEKGTQNGLTDEEMLSFDIHICLKTRTFYI